MIRFMCLLCNRCKFTQKSGHTCNGQYRKRGIKWQKMVYSLKDAK